MLRMWRDFENGRAPPSCPWPATASFVGHGSDRCCRRLSRCRGHPAKMSVSRDHIAEQHVTLTVEANQPHLLDRTEVRGTGLQPDSRQQERRRQIEVGGLVHDVLPRQIVAALSENLYHC